MNKVFVSALVLVVVIAALMVFQATKVSSSHVYLPSELLQQNSNLKRIKVGGRVADFPIDYQLQPKIKLEFKIHDVGTASDQVVLVVYEGLKPDMFAVGRDVIVEGEWIDDRIIATNLLTQCPSKYEPPTPK